MCPIGRCTKINSGVLALCIFIIPNRCLSVNIVSRTFFFCFAGEAKEFYDTRINYSCSGQARKVVWRLPSVLIISYSFGQINRALPFWQSGGTILIMSSFWNTWGIGYLTTLTKIILLFYIFAIHLRIEETKRLFLSCRRHLLHRIDC